MLTLQRFPDATLWVMALPTVRLKNNWFRVTPIVAVALAVFSMFAFMSFGRIDYDRLFHLSLRRRGHLHRRLEGRDPVRDARRGSGQQDRVPSAHEPPGLARNVLRHLHTTAWLPANSD